MKKWTNDFIQGLAILILTLAALIYSTSLGSSWITDFLARPDIYMMLVLGILALLALLLIVRALRQRKTKTGQEICAPIWTSLPMVTVIVLFVYLLILDKIGFVLDSIVMLWMLTFLYSVNSGENKQDRDNKKAVIKEAIRSGLFAIVCSFAVYYIFTKVLSARLPVFGLF